MGNLFDERNLNWRSYWVGFSMFTYNYAFESHDIGSEKSANPVTVWKIQSWLRQLATCDILNITAGEHGDRITLERLNILKHKTHHNKCVNLGQSSSLNTNNSNLIHLKYFLNLVNLNQMWIIITLSWLTWHPNRSEKCNLIIIQTWTSFCTFYITV